MADKREERFRVVPIARDERIAQDIDGDQYYKQRGDTVVDEVEIVSETPFETAAGSTVIPKSDDVQQADYQVENPPVEEEVYYDEPEVYDEADDYGNYDGGDFEEEAPKRRRAASHPGKKPFFKRAWVYIVLVLVLAAAGSVFYWKTGQTYASQLAVIQRQVADITEQMDLGDRTQGATLDDQIAFYTEQCDQARKQNSAFEQLNRSHWWLFSRADAQDIGLAQLNDRVEELTPLLNNLGVFMEQVEQVVMQVKGTPQNPGHLLVSLELTRAHEILQNDRNMIANALSMCDELENLPEAFQRGKENLQRELEVLDTQVVLMQDYITAILPIEAEVSTFCAAARDFYARTFTDNFADDLQAHYSVIARSDTIQENINKINGQPRFASLPHYYGISDFALDEAGTRILEEEGVVQTARNIVLSVRSQDEKIASAPADYDLCAKEIESNAGYIEQLRQLALPQEYKTGSERYIEALEARADYLDAHLEYADALGDVNACKAELDAAQKRRQSLSEEIAQALKDHDMDAFRQKSDELEDVLDEIEDKQDAYNRANAAVQPLLQEENRLFDAYQAIVS
ncbi:MAG: hypothetical protein J6L88_05635 [Clostridia bacterium]|nr:hypothetical protein [Clostridia bacterium]